VDDGSDEWSRADEFSLNVAHLNHVLDREIARSEQMLLDARQGTFRCPPEVAEGLAEATDTFVAELSQVWLRMSGFDRPESFDQADPLPAVALGRSEQTFDSVVLRILEWSQNSATAFNIAGGLEPGSNVVEPGYPETSD